jgi:hypothetical protein
MTSPGKATPGDRPGQFQKSETSLLTSPVVRGYRLTSARKVQASNQQGGDKWTQQQRQL